MFEREAVAFRAHAEGGRRVLILFGQVDGQLFAGAVERHEQFVPFELAHKAQGAFFRPHGFENAFCEAPLRRLNFTLETPNYSR